MCVFVSVLISASRTEIIFYTKIFERILYSFHTDFVPFTVHYLIVLCSYVFQHMWSISIEVYIVKYFGMVMFNCIIYKGVLHRIGWGMSHVLLITTHVYIFIHSPCSPHIYFHTLTPRQLICVDASHCEFIQSNYREGS